LGRTLVHGRLAIALGALALCLLGASPAHAAFDCGALMTCQTQVDNSGRVWFWSPELLTEDALGDGTLRHGVLQVFERDGDTTTLVHGPDGKPIPPSPKHRYSESLSGVSPDGERVYISTEASLTPEDHDVSNSGDTSTDGYELHDGHFTLITTGPLDESRPDSFGCCGARIVWASDDGSRVYFVTNDRMTAADHDDGQDIYERSEGRTQLVSTGPEEVQPDLNYSEPTPYAEFLGASPDGTTVYFTTYQQLTADDTEKLTSDIYSWHDGTVRRLTHTRLYPEGSGIFESFSQMSFAGADEGGSIYFVAHSPQASGDTDANGDLYRADAEGNDERILAGGAAPPISDKPYPDPIFAGDVSQDGKRLYFTTTSALLPADTDDEPDIYLLMTETGHLQLVSEGRAAEPPKDAELTLSGISRDGRRAFFSTWEQLTPEDTDEVVDVYEWFEGHVRLATPDIPGHRDASFFDSISPNGRYVVFSTWENLDPDSEEQKSDIYLADMGSEANATTSASGSGAAARPGRRRRRHRTVRRINVESIPPRMRVGTRGSYGDGVARLRLGCPKAEASGPCHGTARIFSRGGRALAAGHFRIASGHRAWVALRGPGLARSGRLDAIVRVRGADMLHNVARVHATVELRHTP
jgi:Tol biopolymer transport system component